MQSQSLISSTKWPDVLFGGQSLIPYVMPWGQLSLSTDKANAFELSTVDEGPDGRVRFLTTAEITGASIADLPQAALCRMFCIYVVTHLSEKYLLDACHSLAEIYSWQINEAKQSKQISGQTYHQVSQVTQREKPPFVYDE